MRRLLALAAVAVTVTACTPKVVMVAPPTTLAPSTTVAPTTTEPAPVTTAYRPATVNPERQYIRDIYVETNIGDFLDEDKLMAFGYLVCSHYQGGGTDAGLVDMMYKAGVANNLSDSQMLEWASAAGIAVRNLCPEYAI